MMNNITDSSLVTVSNRAVTNDWKKMKNNPTANQMGKLGRVPLNIYRCFTNT